MPPSLTDRLAVHRTELAVRRTWLAVVRTSIALFAGGAGLFRFFDGAFWEVIGLISMTGSVPLLVSGWRARERELARLREEEAG